MSYFKFLNWAWIFSKYQLGLKEILKFEFKWSLSETTFPIFDMLWFTPLFSFYQKGPGKNSCLLWEILLYHTNCACIIINDWILLRRESSFSTELKKSACFAIQLTFISTSLMIKRIIFSSHNLTNSTFHFILSAYSLVTTQVQLLWTQLINIDHFQVETIIGNLLLSP